MNHQTHKIINLQAYQNHGTLWPMEEHQHQYQCLLAGNRLAGNCEVLIYNQYQRTAELFRLYFSSECRIVLYYFQEEEVLLWKQNRASCLISYCQALTLLGDAVRRMYREQGAQNEWSTSHDSVHVQRTWQHAYYNSTHSNLEWLLMEQEFIPFIQQYFQAINNRDAVLLYDSMAESRKKHIARELYAYNWSHTLDEVMILDFAVIDSKKMPEDDIWVYYLTLCGEYSNGEILSVDICLHLALEHGCVRLQDEYVLEASHIASCCVEI